MTPERRAVALATMVIAALGLVPGVEAAGPPFPPPVEDQAVYDTAGAFRPATVEQVEATIDAIEQRTGAEIAVYTQLVPCCETTDQAEHNARALMDQWGVGRRGFDDGLVILFDLREDDPCHGQVQLYAGPGYRREVPLQLRAPGGVRERHAAAAQALRPRRRAAHGHPASTRRRRRSTPRQLNLFRILNAVARPAGRAARVRADRRRRADRVVSPRTRPGLPRRPLDPHPGTAGRSHPGGRRGHPRREVDAPRPDDGEPRPRRSRPDRVRRRGGGPARSRPPSLRSTPRRRPTDDPVEMARLNRARARPLDDATSFLLQRLRSIGGGSASSTPRSC